MKSGSTCEALAAHFGLSGDFVATTSVPASVPCRCAGSVEWTENFGQVCRARTSRVKEQPAPPDPGQSFNRDTFVENTMTISSIDEDDSKGTQPDGSKIFTASARESKSLREQLKKIIPEHREKIRNNGTTDVTDLVWGTLRCVFEELQEQTVMLEGEYLASEHDQEKALRYLLRYEAQCPKAGLLELEAVCSEIDPMLTEEALLGILRSEGYLSNLQATWNQPIVEQLGAGLIVSCLRIVQTAAGELLSHYHPYATPAGKRWLLKRFGGDGIPIVRIGSAVLGREDPAIQAGLRRDPNC